MVFHSSTTEGTGAETPTDKNTTTHQPLEQSSQCTCVNKSYVIFPYHQCTFVSIYLSIYLYLYSRHNNPLPKKNETQSFLHHHFFSFFLSLLFLTYFPCLYLSLSCPTYSCVPVPVPFIFGINHTIYIDCPLDGVTAPSNSQRVVPGIRGQQLIAEGLSVIIRIIIV